MSYSFDKFFIDGSWCEPTQERRIELVNPATKSVFATVPEAAPADVEAAVVAAAAAQPEWAAVKLQERADLMQRMLDVFKTHREAIIELEAQELGAPVSFGASAHCDYQFVRIQSYIDIARGMALEERFAKSTVLREPVGVVACVTPWNYPLGQVVQKVVPALLMGNTVVLKPSQHTPLTCYLMMDAFERAGFPKGVVNLICGRGARLGNVLSRHLLVDMVSFTGSTQVGVQLAQAGLEGVKRISLELGGKSPCIWLPGADYEPWVPLLMNSIFLNSGQTCTALSRLLVHQDDLPRVEALLRKHVADYPVGDPMDPAVRIGPVASKAQFDKVSEYIALGIKEGARLIAGGIPDEPENGYYVGPTIFSDVTNDMRIAREEIFGPVLCVLTYRTPEQAVAIANDTPYGLNAMVCGPRQEAMALARRIKAGNVYINDAPRDVTAPFGGYKQSGIGREGGIAGLLEFTQYKAIIDRATLP